MQETYIVDAIRTPIGSLRGSLSTVRADDLAAHVLRALIARHRDLDLDRIDEVIMGCANQAGEDNRNVARMALLLAGIPVSVPGETVNRLCASGMSAVIHAHRAIQAQDGDLFICGGVEHMTRGPWVVSKASAPFGNDSEMYDSSFGWRFVNPLMKSSYGTDSMGETAENLVAKYHISREDQDLFAYRSQWKAALARKQGKLAEEISPLALPQRKGDPVWFREDEFMKPDTSVEILSKLRPAFKSYEEGGSVTAGNSSGLNDGAAAMLVVSEKIAAQLAMQPKVRILASAVVGVEPRVMGIGPVEASRKALRKAGLSLDQMDLIEINEAFAAQVLACTRSLGLADDDPRINPNGGAIALGHPLGMSGVRILQTASLELVRSNLRYALVSMCIGVGQGYATIIERI